MSGVHLANLGRDYVGEMNTELLHDQNMAPLCKRVFVLRNGRRSEWDGLAVGHHRLRGVSRKEPRQVDRAALLSRARAAQ